MAAPLSPRVETGGNPNSAIAAPSPPLSPPPASARGRDRANPGRCWRRRGLLVLSRARCSACCHLHGVGVVRPPDTMARLLSGVWQRWSGGCVADGVAVGRRGGGIKGCGDGRRRLRGLPFTTDSLDLLGWFRGPDLGLS
jgi:hypothetical protein